MKLYDTAPASSSRNTSDLDASDLILVSTVTFHFVNFFISLLHSVPPTGLGLSSKSWALVEVRTVFPLAHSSETSVNFGVDTLLTK